MGNPVQVVNSKIWLTMKEKVKVKLIVKKNFKWHMFFVSEEEIKSFQ